MSKKKCSNYFMGLVLASQVLVSNNCYAVLKSESELVNCAQRFQGKEYEIQKGCNVNFLEAEFYTISDFLKSKECKSGDNSFCLEVKTRNRSNIEGYINEFNLRNFSNQNELIRKCTDLEKTLKLNKEESKQDKDVEIEYFNSCFWIPQVDISGSSRALDLLRVSPGCIDEFGNFETETPICRNLYIKAWE